MSSEAVVTTMWEQPGLNVFWTPYDPLDLAGDSLDPLGFSRGYLALADLLLPGLTTITNRPRYVPMLVAAIQRARAAETAATTPVRARAQALRRIKAFECAWALAWVLAAQRNPKGYPLAGLRGVRAVKRRLETLGSRRTVKTSSFELLSDQLRYGGLGAYGTLLEHLHLGTMLGPTLKPLGERLAEAFPSPAPLRVEDEDVPLPLELLRAWGERACSPELTQGEREALREALQGGEEAEEVDHVRWTAMRLLARLASREAEAPEPVLLRAMRQGLTAGTLASVRARPEHVARITAALLLIEPYERCYQAALFLFDALRGAATDEDAPWLGDVAQQQQIQIASNFLRKSAAELPRALDRAANHHDRATREISKALEFSGLLPWLPESVGRCEDNVQLLALLIERHALVQVGKLEGGLPKAPWLRWADRAGTVRLCAQRFRIPPGARLRRWTEVPRHAYRTQSALAFTRACGVRG